MAHCDSCLARGGSRRWSHGAILIESMKMQEYLDHRMQSDGEFNLVIALVLRTEY
jgi:hypothetical protein